MLKTYLKQTPLGVKIIYSNLYQKIRHPDDFKKQLEEYNFYKNLIQSIIYKNDLIFDVGANVGAAGFFFSGGTTGGGGGGGTPRRFPRIHLPRITGEVRVG